MFIFLLAAAHALAPEVLDHEMTAEERKLTGIHKLSDKEKSVLQRWIDSHYEKREVVVAQKLTGKHPTLSENLQSGQYIELSDNTIWQIRPKDLPISQGWITPAEIIVTQSGDRNYPSKLTNSVTGSSVFAKRVESVPTQKTQKPLST